MPDKFLLKLYIAGRTPRTEVCIRNLKYICNNDLGGKFELEIIDVLEKPHLAEHDNIVATPTLIKKLPPPVRQLIGDLSSLDKVLVGLGLEHLA